MGEVAEMMLEGILCEGCGEYLGDAAGFPQRCSSCGGGAPLDTHSAPTRYRAASRARRAARHNRERRAIAKERKPFECHCGKLFADCNALAQHQQAKHPGTAQPKKPHVCDCGSAFRLPEHLAQHRADKHGLVAAAVAWLEP
ncbi:MULTISPECIES: hypothetical protein [unclassified Bradyrhizobium]|uniref:hypothetical protein n=1 Tax=unclassified Bradyrhizobium TaxID=2631580 RepID=UPI0029161946|nr:MULTISPECIES: hypothetical protein [unclassified Bradyrhizobium]